MIENKKFHINKNIIENMPGIIDSFVSFYGEENREQIVKKFSNVIISGYYTSTGLRSILYDEKTKIANKVVEEFKQENNLSKDKIKAIFGANVDFNYIPLISTFNKDFSKEYGKISLLNFIKDYSKEDIKSLDEPRAIEIIEELKELLPKVKEAKNKYESLYNENLKPYGDYIESIRKVENSIYQKYSMDFLEELKKYASNNNDEFLQKLCSVNIQGLFMGGPLNPLDTGLIDCFSKESEEKLKGPKTIKFIKDSIINDRITYYKKLGLKLGDNIEDYEKDERCKRATPSFELVDNIIRIREEYRRKAIIEIVESMPHHKQILDRIKEEHLLSDLEFSKKVNNGTICIETSYKEENGQYVLQPVLFFDGNIGQDIMDCSLMHELNHLYELTPIDINKETAYSICGWDIVKESTVGEVDNNRFFEKDVHDRKYELLNEIINEFIAQDISKIMHKKGITLSCDITNVRDTSMTSYETILRRFARTFYEEFKDEIIKSRKDGNIKALLEVIGEDNFEEYNALLTEYYNRFQGMKIYELYRKLDNNIDNEDTRYYNECVEKTRALYQKFREHKINYEKGKTNNHR